MASDWQQWYMHKIDAWQGSATVQAFTDAAYRAFHHLIMAQFQQEDGKLPNSDLELAKYSRAGVQWGRKRKGLPTICEEVMPHFVADDNGRVFNRVQLELWEASKARHLAHVERTRKAAEAKAAKHTQQYTQNDSLASGLEKQNDSLTNAKHDEVEVEVEVEVGSKNKNPCAETSSAPALDPEGNLFTLPLNDGSAYLIPAADCVRWATVYPAVNILEQLLLMREWCIAHPRKRKTRRGVNTFITSWLGRAQDRPARTNEVNHGTSQPSPAKQRVNGNIAALKQAIERRGFDGTVGADCADRAAVSTSGPKRVDGGLSTGLRSVGAEVFTGVVP